MKQVWVGVETRIYLRTTTARIYSRTATARVGVETRIYSRTATARIGRCTDRERKEKDPKL